MKEKIFNAQEVQAIIAGNETKLKLYRVNYKYEENIVKSFVKEDIFYFKNNQIFDDYLFLKEDYSPELFLEKKEPSSRYYEESFKVNGLPVRYSKNSYDPKKLKEYLAIAIDPKGNIHPLKYNYIAKGFGYIGYISEHNETFYLNRE